MFYQFIRKRGDGYSSGWAETSNEIVKDTSPAWRSMIGWSVPKMIDWLNFGQYRWMVQPEKPRHLH